MFCWRNHAALLALLLCDVGYDVEEILLDDEYTGQRGVIKHRLAIYLDRLGCRVDPGAIKFGFVGKHSRVHDLAIEVSRGSREPDGVVRAEDLLGLITKRNRGLQSGEV